MRPTLNYKRKKFGMPAILICSLLLLAAQPFARAQDCHGGPPPPGEQGDMHGPPPPGPPDGLRSTMRGGLQLGPPGRWWDDKEFAQELGLSTAQARRMDEIFQANRGTLLRLYRSVQQRGVDPGTADNGEPFARETNLSTNRSGQRSPRSPRESERAHAAADPQADDRGTDGKAGPASSKATALRLTKD